MEIPELLDGCRRGDELAWEALVRRFQSRVYGIAVFYLGNTEEARDLAQEVFVRLYRRLDACTNDETFVPWLIQITRNAAVDRLRRMKTRPQRVGTPVDEMWDLASPAPGPEEHLQTTRRRDLVHRAVARLSRINREIILLKEIQGMGLESIAELLKVPLGTVKSRSNRARIELAREIVAIGQETGVDPAGGELP
jgi:RNA polymerase sigma-70 factor, ECF subfamily